MSTAADYLKLLSRPVEKLEGVPQLGTVYVRGLAVPAYERFENACITKEPGGPSPTVVLLRYGMVDEAGKPVWTDEHLPALADMSADVSRPITKAILRLCGLGADVGKS